MDSRGLADLFLGVGRVDIVESRFIGKPALVYIQIGTSADTS